jgi:polysaccharide deacetylase family protein (PEP-CTERM system associated)
MFVLGKFAEKFPKIIKRIASEGHEIASHGYGHIEIFNQTPLQFRKDIGRAKELLEDLIGKPVIGYRAPDFSIISSTIWAFEILAEQGYEYDSSVFPIISARYGIASWPVFPVCMQLKSGRSIVELPLSTIKAFGRNWPVSGGGYHRLLPSQIILWAIKQVHQAGRPFIAYCHPYEFDALEFDTLKNKIPLKTRLHQGLGRQSFQPKFEKMLSFFEIVQARHVALEQIWPAYTP